jgi:hypothetical protein
MSTKSLRVIGAVARPPAHDWHDNNDWDWKHKHDNSHRSRSHRSRDKEHDDCHW